MRKQITLTTGKRAKARLLLLTLLLVATFCISYIPSVLSGPSYVISGDSVFFDDSRVFLNVTPHTLVGSGWVVVDLRSKVYSGDVNLVVGVDSVDLKADGLERFNPHNETFNYTCDGVNTFFNYTLSPKHFWCYENVSVGNSTEFSYVLLFDRDFDSGNIPLRTAFWSESVDWTPLVVPITTIPYSFDGKDKWYFAENLPIVSNVTYKIRVHFSVAPTQLGTAVRTYKYDFGIYPSSYGTTASGLLNATSNGHLYFIDPWTQGTTENVAYFNLSETSGTVAVNMLSNATLNMFNLTLYRYTIQSIVNVTVNTPGILGKGFNFSNGSNGVIEKYGYPGLGVGRRGVGGSFWVYLTSADQYDTIFRLWNAQDDEYIQLAFDPLTDSIAFASYASAVEIKDQLNYTSYFGKWTHIAFTINTTERKVWFNNTLVLNKSVDWGGAGVDPSDIIRDGSLFKNGYLLFGNYEYRTPNRAMNGSIDEIAIFNRTINAAEVDYLYNNNAPGKNQQPPYVDTSPVVGASNFSSHYYGALSNITVNVSGESTIAWANFTLAAPNGTIMIDNENGTNSSVLFWFSRSNVTLVNGTYNITITVSDGVTAFTTNAYQEIITDTKTLFPAGASFNLNSYNTTTFSFNLSHDSNQNFVFNYSDDCNTTYFNITQSASQMVIGLNQKGQNNLTIKSLNVPVGSYFCNVSVNNTYDNRFSYLQFNFSITNIVPVIMFNPNTTIAGMYRNTGIFASVNASDNGQIDLLNITLWNSTNSMVLNSTLSPVNTSAQLNVNFTGLADGLYYLNATVNDTDNSVVTTATRTIMLDNTAPVIAFNVNTTSAGNHSFNSVFASVNASDLFGFMLNVTLWNATNSLVLNKTGATSIDFNFTGLDDGVYYLNATVNDTINNINATETIVYDLDTKNPFIAFNLNTTVSGAHRNRGVFGSVNASDVHYNFTNLTVFNGGGLVLNYSSTTNFTEFNFSNLADGTYYLNATAWDNLTHSNITATRTIILDNVSPSISFNGNTTQTGLYKVSGVFASLNFSDANGVVANVSLWDSLGNQVVNKSSAVSPISINFTGLTTGAYYLNATANDTAGNFNYTATYTITLDLTNPTISFNANTTPAGYHRNQGIYGSVSAADNDAFSFNITLWNSTDGLVGNYRNNTATGDVNFSDLPDGWYTLNGSVNDTVGHSVGLVRRVIYLDNSSPSLVFNTNTTATGLYKNTWIFASLDFSDTNIDFANVTLWNAVNVIVVNKTSSTSPININFTGLATGVYYLNASSRDYANNWNGTAKYTITLDSTLPSISFNANTTSEGMRLQNSIYASVSASDNDAFSFNITLWNSTNGLVKNYQNSTAIGEYNFTGLADGVYYLNGTINDTAGNYNSLTKKTITLDTIPPFIGFNDNTTQTGVYRVTGIFASINFSDANSFMSNVTLWNGSGTMVLNKTAATAVTEINFTGLTTGTYYLNATVNDTAGNINSTAKYTITLDLVNPTIVFNLNTTATGSYNNSFVYASVNCSDNVAVNLTNITVFNSTNGLVLNFTGFSSIVEHNFSGLDDGVYKLNATAMDNVTNVNMTETRTIILDNGAPTISYNANTTTNGTIFRLTGIFASINASDSLTGWMLNITLWNGSGSLVLNYSTNNTSGDVNFTALPDGLYTLNASVNDTFKHFTYLNNYNYTLDNIAPVVVSANFSTPYFGALSNFTANLTNISGEQVSWVNFTVYSPNGTKMIDNENGTNVSSVDWITKTNLTLTNGTYTINLTIRDNVSVAMSNEYSFTRVITDLMNISNNKNTYSSESYNANGGDTVNLSFNISHDSNQLFNFNFTSNCSSGFIITYGAPSVPVGMGQVRQQNASIQLSGIASGVYYCYVNVTRTYDNRTKQVDLYFTVDTSLANIYLYTDDNLSQCSGVGCDRTNSMLNTATTNSSPTWHVRNFGNLNATGCNATLSGTFGSGSDYNASFVNQTIVAGGSVPLYMTYITPSVGTYTGYLNVTCVGYLNGTIIGLSQSNDAYVQLSVTSAGGGESPGGGGGSTTTIVQSTIANQTISGGCNFNGVCEPERGEDIFNCGVNLNYTIGNVTYFGDCRPFDFNQFFCIDKTQPCSTGAVVIKYLSLLAIIITIVFIVRGRIIKKKKK